MSRAALACLLVCVLALTGCDALADLGQLRSDLDAAGYDATSIDHHTTNGDTVLSVAVSTGSAPAADDPENDAENDAGRVAEVVWTTFPGEFDRLTVSVDGQARLDESYDDLLGRFGERPAGMAEPDNSNPALLVGSILAGAAVFAGLMVLLWHRGRRRPPPVAPPPPGHPHQPGGYYQYPPPPPPG